MNSIYYIGKNNLEASQKKERIEFLLKEILQSKEETEEIKKDYLELMDLCNPVELYTLLNEKVTPSSIKIKDREPIKSLQKMRILRYAVVNQEKTYQILYEIPPQTEDLISYYKRKKNLIEYINLAILNEDKVFIQAMSSYIQEIPCYGWLQAKSLKKQIS